MLYTYGSGYYCYPLLKKLPIEPEVFRSFDENLPVISDIRPYISTIDHDLQLSYTLQRVSREI